MNRLIFLIAAIIALSFGTANEAMAQALPSTVVSTTDAPPTLPDPLTPETVRELVSTMSDQDVRKFLLQRLDAVAEEEAANHDATKLADVATQAANVVYTSIYQAVAKLPVLISAQPRAISTFIERHTGAGVLRMFAAMIFAVGIALVVEKLAQRLTHKWHDAAANMIDPDSLRSTLRFLFRRFLTEIFGLLLFFGIIFTIMPMLLDPFLLASASLFLTTLVLPPRFSAAFSRFILAPNRPAIRLINVSDMWAKRWHKQQMFLFFLVGFSVFIVPFNASNGIAQGETRLGFWFNLGIHLYIIGIAWQGRAALVDMMRGSDPDVTWFDERIARAYPYFSIGVVAATWVLVEVLAGFGQFELLFEGPHYVTMFLMLMMPAIDTSIRGLVRHLVPPIQGEGPIAERAYYATKRSYIRIGRVVMVSLIILTIADAWHIDLSNLAAQNVGAAFAGRLVEFLIILAAGYLVWEFVSLWVNRKLAAEQTALGVDPEEQEIGGDGGGAGGSRLSTVLPLVLASARAAILIIFGLLALANLGVDTTPLLAGAGIVGLAIGFGAQKLVTDVVSGVFFLIDDAFRTGEYVSVDGTMGTVEKISIRSMQLRHHRGPVHTIPYGEIPKLTNYSRDWVIMKLKFTVPFDTDPNKVKKVFKKIGAEMLENEIFKDDFLQPFKSQGVFEIDDVGMVMRGKFMAKPGKQFMIRKEIYNQVKAQFAANGIDFARREVRVALPGMDHPEELTEADKAAIAAAASQAAQDQLADQLPAKDKPGN